MYPGEVTRIAVRFAPTDVPTLTPTTRSAIPLTRMTATAMSGTATSSTTRTTR